MSHSVAESSVDTVWFVKIIDEFELSKETSDDYDSQPRGPRTKTSGWLQSQLSLSSFRG